MKTANNREKKIKGADSKPKHRSVHKPAGESFLAKRLRPKTALPDKPTATNSTVGEHDKQYADGYGDGYAKGYSNGYAKGLSMVSGGSQMMPEDRAVEISKRRRSPIRHASSPALLIESIPPPTRYSATQTPRPDCVVSASAAGPRSFHSLTRGHSVSGGAGDKRSFYRLHSEMDDDKAAAVLAALVYEGAVGTSFNSTGATRVCQSPNEGAGVFADGDRGRNLKEEEAVAAAIAAALAWSPTRARKKQTREQCSHEHEIAFDESDVEELSDYSSSDYQSRKEGGMRKVTDGRDDRDVHNEGQMAGGGYTASDGMGLAPSVAITRHNRSSGTRAVETPMSGQNEERVMLTWKDRDSNTDDCDDGDDLDRERTKPLLTSSPSPVDSETATGNEWTEKDLMSMMAGVGIGSTGSNSDVSSRSPRKRRTQHVDDSLRKKQESPPSDDVSASHDGVIRAIGTAVRRESEQSCASSQVVSTSGSVKEELKTYHVSTRGCNPREEDGDASYADSVGCSRLEKIERGMGMGVVGARRKKGIGRGNLGESRRSLDLGRESREGGKGINGRGRVAGEKEWRSAGGSQSSSRRSLLHEEGLRAIEDDSDSEDYGHEDSHVHAGDDVTAFDVSVRSQISRDIILSQQNRPHRDDEWHELSFVSEREGGAVVTRVGAVGCASEMADSGTASKAKNIAAIPYSRLSGVGRHWPRGVNPARREEWLSPREFIAVFGMSYPLFRRLPSWKRIILKQDVGLF